MNMEQSPITTERELADAILQLVDEEKAQITLQPRLQALYKLKRGFDLDEDLSRCGVTLEALFQNNAMSGGSGARYTFGRSRAGVPQIERVQENMDNEGTDRFPVVGGQPFSFAPYGAPGPFIQPLMPPMFYAPPLFAPRQQFQNRQPQEFKPRQQPQEFQPRQQTQTPQPPSPTVAEPPRFVRMKELYQMVDDQVNKSKSGRISIEMLFDNILDVLKEQNLTLNSIQTSDWKGVIHRGVNSEDDELKINAVLMNGILYKTGCEPQNAVMVSQQNPSPAAAPSFGGRNLVSEMQQQLRISHDEDRGPVPFKQAVEDYRQSNNQSKQMQQNQGFSQPTASNAYPVSSGESLVNTTTNSSRSYSETSRAPSRFSAPITTFPAQDHIKEEKIRGRISWGYIEHQITCWIPVEEDERAVQAKAVKKCKQLWEKKVHELPEVMFLLKSQWVREREIAFTQLGHSMFSFILEDGEGELDWGRFGLTPDDLAPLRLYVVADQHKKTVQVNEHIQLLSIYQMDQGSLAAQVYKLLEKLPDGEGLGFLRIMRDTEATCKGGWQAIMHNDQCYDYIEEELLQHSEIFTVNGDQGFVQLRFPMAHLVVC